MEHSYSQIMLGLTHLYIESKININTYTKKIIKVLREDKIRLDKAFDEMKRVKRNLSLEGRIPNNFSTL